MSNSIFDTVLIKSKRRNSLYINALDTVMKISPIYIFSFIWAISAKIARYIFLHVSCVTGSALRRLQSGAR